MATTTDLYLLFILFLSVSTSVRGTSFSVNLIHRDSPQSPFYNPLDTSSDRLQKAVHRSMNRASHLKRLSLSTYSVDQGDDTISTSASLFGFSFLMNISLGTPPRNVFAVTDTGSDLTWVQCKPCQDCYEQISPLFDPTASSTYRDVLCTSQTCAKLGPPSCDNNHCQYHVGYGDKSFSNGNLAFETITFDSTGGRSIQLPNIAFGCSKQTQGTFIKEVSGLVGLGGGDISLTSQLGSKIGSKFSYCISPYDDVSSKLTFGSNDGMTGEDVLSTSLISDPSDKTYYYLKLEGISVNENRVPFRSSASSTIGDDHIIIDSGTTLTVLPEEMYLELESEIKKAIDAEPLISPPGGLKLCYVIDAVMKFPDVTVHFTNADIKLGMRNYFFPYSGAVCLSFVPSPFKGTYIYGNRAQMNFLIEYAPEERKVSFKPTDCTRVN